MELQSLNKTTNSAKEGKNNKIVLPHFFKF